MKPNSYNPYVSAQTQFDNVAAMINLEPGVRELLRQPLREIHFTIPVKMDDGSTKVFKGFRIVHNDARGPAKGGIRFHPHETAIPFARERNAVVDIPAEERRRNYVNLSGKICEVQM